MIVCPLAYPILNSNSHSSNIAVLLRKTELIKQNCQIELAQSPFAMFIKGETPGKWHFSLSSATELTIDCPKKYSKLSISKQGTLTLASGCSASDGVNYIPAFTEFHSVSTSLHSNISVEPLPTINEIVVDDQDLNLASNDANLEHHLKSIAKLDTHDVPTVSLSDIERNVKPLSPLGLDIRRVHYVGISSLVVIFGLLCSVVVYVHCKRKADCVLRHDHQDRITE
jgi:hypothetical protein